MGDRKQERRGQSDHPAYLLTPVVQGSGQMSDPAQYVRALWEGRYWIFIPMLVVGLAVFAIISVQAPSFVATSTLLLQPPRFSTELKPIPLSIESYQAILDSDMVFEQVRSKLIASGVLGPETSLGEVRGMCSTELVSSLEVERAGERPFVPLIHLVVKSKSPELSAGAANIWADVFLKESSRLLSEGSQSTLDFIEAQYPVAKSALEDARSRLREQQDHYARAENQTARQWDQKITSFSAETERLLADYRKTTERLRLEFLAKWQPDLLKQQLYVKEKTLVSYQEELLKIALKRKSLKETLTRLQSELEKQPRVLVLSKAITDEALWQQVGEGRMGIPGELDRLKLRTEQVNPVYMELSNRAAEAQVEHDSLVPRGEFLQSEIESLRKEIEELRGLVTQTDIELFAMQEDRSEGLAVLTESRTAELESLSKQRELELEVLGREKDYTVVGLSKEFESLESTFAVLAEKYEAARLARQESAPDVRVAARAVAPGSPLNRQPVLYAGVAALLTLFASAGVLLVSAVGRAMLGLSASRSQQAPSKPELQARGEDHSAGTSLLRS